MGWFSTEMTPEQIKSEETKRAKAAFEKQAEYVSGKLALDPGAVNRVFAGDDFSLKAYYNRLSDARFMRNFFTMTMIGSGGAFLASFAAGPAVALRLGIFTLGGALLSHMLRNGAAQKVALVENDVKERIKLLPKPDSKPDDGLRYS